MKTSHTMRHVVAFGNSNPGASFRQYARWLVLLLEWRGYAEADRDRIAGDMPTFLSLAPRFDRRDATLLRDLPWKKETYQQYQRGARLLVETFTGERAAKVARKAARDDAWEALMGDTSRLAAAGLVAVQRVAGLATIADRSRAAEIRPRELTGEILVGLKASTRTPKEWTSVVNGGRLLDDLRQFPTLAAHLPALPIGPVTASWRAPMVVPPHLEARLEAWLGKATVIPPNGKKAPAAFAAAAGRHSPGAAGIFRAGMRAYLTTLGGIRSLADAPGLEGLFTEPDVQAVVMAWTARSGATDGLKPTTMTSYLDCVKLTLERNGQPEAAGLIAAALDTFPILLEGRAARKLMAPRNKKWCKGLLADPDRVRLFETQHVAYVRRAKAALDEAAAAGFDLVALSRDPEAMRRLKGKRRKRARLLLRRARKFGVCAAFAAIELEGAPLRQSNTRCLDRSGPKATFFDHSRTADPHFLIVIPNELLKNGKALTGRGAGLPPIFIRRQGSGDAGPEILKFFLERIRPLFPRAATSAALFPGLEADAPHLLKATFGNWLLECSTEIGLRQTSHNFRHGMCSIQINDDPGCIEELAVFLGDTPGVLRRYYAFIDEDRQLKTMQRGFAERRSRHGASRGLAAALRA